jgi:hypothetical protein
LLKRLEAYKEEHGDCLVPAKSYEQDTELGHWVRNQRMKYKRGMRQDRIEKLEGLGFTWIAGYMVG